MDYQFLSLRTAAAAALLLFAGCATSNGEAVSKASAPSNHAGLQFVDRDGVSHTLAKKGATFVFWQPWCKACREEAPAAVAASQDLAETMVFYGVVSGPDGAVDEDLVDKSIEELGLYYPQIRDKDLALARRFGVTKTPTIIVLDAAGQLRFKGSHMPSDWASLE